MSKHVVVIASGETERRSLPHLVSHLQDQDVFVDEVRIPPGNAALNVSMAARLIKAAWYARLGSSPPDKFVILVDLDNKTPNDALGARLEIVDTSKPDDIENPKNHLKNVLDERVYTARVSEEIAMSLDPTTIAGRSPSFRGFLEAVKNGVSSGEADGP